MINLINRDNLIEKLLETESDDIENTDFNFGYIEAINTLIDLLYNVPVIHTNWVVDWIPCSERLPEKDESVLIYACGHRVQAYYDKANDCFRLTEDENLYYKKENVTHWIPLPDTPEQKTCEIVWTNADSLRHMIGIDNEEFIHKIGTDCNRCAYIHGACNCDCLSGNIEWLNQSSDYKGLNLDFMKKDIVRVAEDDSEITTRHGYWKAVTESEISGWDVFLTGGYDPIALYVCSECGEDNILDEFGENFLPKYCPFCGARLMNNYMEDDNDE